MFNPIGKTDVYTVNGSKRYLSSELKAMGYTPGAAVKTLVGPDTLELLELVVGAGASQTRARVLEVK